MIQIIHTTQRLHQAKYFFFTQEDNLAPRPQFLLQQGKIATELDCIAEPLFDMHQQGPPI